MDTVTGTETAYSDYRGSYQTNGVNTRKQDSTPWRETKGNTERRTRAVTASYKDHYSNRDYERVMLWTHCPVTITCIVLS